MKKLTVKPQSLAWALSLAGFLPFLALSGFIFHYGEGSPFFLLFVDIFKIWSAIILSFLGGIRWGVVISNSISDDPYADENPSAGKITLLLSVLPAMAGLFALLFPNIYCIPILMICFCLQGIWDSFSAIRCDLPKWMGRLRIALTVLVVAAHVVVFGALAQ